MNQSTALGLVYVTLLAQTGCEQPNAGAPEPKRPRLVFITTGTDSFWQEAATGIEAAAKDFKAEFEVVASPSQTDLNIAQEADGLAFSPTNGAVQLVLSGGRVCFLGVDAYKAGRKAAALVREMLPQGGKVIIVSENLDSTGRRQGVLDGLCDGRFIVLQMSLRDAILHLDLACIVALSSPDVTASLQALCAIDKLGQIKLIGFDEDESTVEALATGHLHGVITHQPYQYGYHAVRVMAGAARGDPSVLPKNGFLEIPTVVLRSETASHTAARRLH